MFQGCRSGPGGTRGRGRIQWRSSGPLSRPGDTSEVLSDLSLPERRILEQLLSLMKKPGLKSSVVDSLVHPHLASSDGTHVTVLRMAVLNQDFRLGKSNGLTWIILNSFKNYLEKQKVPGPRVSIMDEAFRRFTRQPSVAILRMASQVFQLGSYPTRYDGEIKELAQQGNYKAACDTAVCLERFHFPLSEFCLPLLLVDNLTSMESYLNHSADLQGKFLEMLDNISSGDIKVDDLVNSYPTIKATAVHKLADKPLDKMIKKYAEKWSLPEGYPKSKERWAKADLSYWVRQMFSSYSQDFSLQLENWREMVGKKVEENKALQEYLVSEVFSYSREEGRHFANLFGIDGYEESAGEEEEEEDWDVGEGVSHRQTEIVGAEEGGWGETEEEEEKMLELPGSAVVKMVDSREKFQEFLRSLEDFSQPGRHIGMDAEFFQQRLNLVQLALGEEVFLLDWESLPGELVQEDWEALKTKLFFQDFLLVGFGLSGDLALLSKYLPGAGDLARTCRNLVDLEGVKSSLSFLVGIESSHLRGLAGLSHSVLGRRLCKDQQIADWSRRPLRPAQITYAALDAYSCWKIFQVFRDRATEMKQEESFYRIISKEAKKEGLKAEKKSLKVEKESIPSKEASVKLAASVPKQAKEVRLVCDDMLQGLSRRLTSLGVDCLSLGNGQDHMDCVSLATGTLKRFVVSKGKAAAMISRELPRGQTLSLQSNELDLQVEEVFKHFNIVVDSSNLLPRCGSCQGVHHYEISQDLLNRLKDNLKRRQEHWKQHTVVVYDDSEEEEEDYDDDHWLKPELVESVEPDEPMETFRRSEEVRVVSSLTGEERRGTVNLFTGHTESGLQLQVEEVPTREIGQTLWACGDCGKFSMTSIASSSDVVGEREALLDQLRLVRGNIEMGITNMERSKKGREQRKKEILLKEMKLILAKLDEEDKKVMGELKSEAFDLMRLCSKFEEEIRTIFSSLSSQSQGTTEHDSLLTELRSVQRKVDKVGFQTFADCLNLSVGSLPSGSMTFMEEVTDSIFLQTPSFSGKSFLLVIPEKSPQFDKSNPELNPSYLEVQVHGSREGPSFHAFLLKRLVVSLRCTVQGSLGTTTTHCLEESSLWSKLEKNQGELLDPRIFKFFIKRPKNTMCKISVKLLTSNISNSPLSYQFLNEARTEQTADSLAVNETGIEIFDNDVDQSCLKALTDLPQLDLSQRKPPHTMLPSQYQWLPQPLSPLSPEFYQLLQPPSAPIPSQPSLLQPSDSSPFRPHCEAVSTMIHSSAATLAKALEAVAPNDLEYLEAEEPEKSLLDPKKKSNLSVEEMQKSLSGSESGDRSSFGLEVDAKHDKSHVSFAAKCSVVEVLATPQVAVSGERRGERYLVTDGQTKEEDGQAGVHSVRRMAVQVAESLRTEENDDVWNKSEVEGGEDCDATVPLEDIAGDGEEYEEAKSWGEETSAEWEEAINALKDLDIRSESSLNCSLWSVVSSSLDSFDFVRGCKVMASYGNIPTDNTTALTSPHDVVYIPQRHCFLVSEPFRNRIGIYEAETFKFVQWLPHPKCYKRFESPSSMLSTANGNVFIVVKDKIEILDPKLNGFQFKMGNFSGLAEGENGDIFTLTYLRNKSAYHIQKLSLGPNKYYKFTGQIYLSVIYENFDNTKMAMPRFLTYNNAALYITDPGLHRVYKVDLRTGAQTAFGHFGSNPGQFLRPTGILSDDSGHLLVSDGNKRLLVFSQTGQFIRVALHGEEDFLRVQQIRRFKDFIIVIKSSSRERPRAGRVIWYQLQDRDSSGQN